MPLLFTNAVISMFSFPRFTSGILGFYFIMRVFHMKGYLSTRGYNRAVATEEVSKLLLFVLIVGSFMSSLKMIGLYPKSGIINGAKNLKNKTKSMFKRKEKV